METKLYNQQAENIGTVELSERVFNVPMNQDLLHQIVVSEMANKRQVIAHTKGRSEVRGGGKKPWRQKGTGRSRHGSIRSPLWRGGGVTFGPSKEKNYSQKVNKKMSRKALSVALSSKLRDGQMVILDNIELIQPKTKEMAVVVKNLNKILDTTKGSYLVITPVHTDALIRASNNLKNVDTIEARNLSPLSVLANKYMVILKDAVAIIEKRQK